MYHVRKKVAVSYSGGKDSALAMYRAVKLGYELICILAITVRPDVHGFFGPDLLSGRGIMGYCRSMTGFEI